MRRALVARLISTLYFSLGALKLLNKASVETVYSMLSRQYLKLRVILKRVTK